MEAPGDPELIAHARAGDKAAFEELLRPMIGPAARLAYGMLQNRAEAEDAMQESALKAWRKLGNLRHGTDFGPWFLGIVANQSRTTLRTPWRGVLGLRDAPESGRPGLEEVTARAADLRKALSALPPDQRAAVLLHFYLDLPLEAVAGILGISLAGVKSRINRGMKRMRPSLRSYEVV
jgi:RNA polymerase sigma factor (sigma-70 family)